MTKFQKAVSSALCLIILTSVFFSSGKKDITKYSMFFPGFSLGYSIINNDKEESDEKISIVDKNDNVEYSFKIFEIFADWFK